MDRNLNDLKDILFINFEKGLRLLIIFNIMIINNHVINIFCQPIKDTLAII